MKQKALKNWLKKEQVLNAPNYDGTATLEDFPLEIGDTVKLKNERGDNWTSSGSMDKYKGAIVRVAAFDKTYPHIFSITDNEGWRFELNDIERYPTKEEIEKSVVKKALYDNLMEVQESINNLLDEIKNDINSLKQ